MAFDDVSNLFLSIVYYVKRFDRNIPEHKHKKQKINNDQIHLDISNENIGIKNLFIYIDIIKCH